MAVNIPKRVASTIINSLKGGVVPRIGLSYITVGRKAEIDALLNDIDIIADGGAAFRFIEGRYGSGKSFLLQAIRNYLMDRNFVVVDADLSPERKLHGNKGQGLATYRELVRNMSTKTRPEGGALPLILDRWVANLMAAVSTETDSESEGFSKAVENRITSEVLSMSEMVRGFDFARLLVLYYRSYVNDDELTKAKVIRWFRGEFVNKTEAKNELGINLIVTDDDWYEYLKVFAAFLKRAGYTGMVILIDELVNLYKIPNRISRENNYEKILSMYNDVLQGKAKYLGIIMCGTPECIENPQRGIYSYEALRSRLADGRFSTDDTKDMLAPVIKLDPLGYEEMTVLVEKLSQIHAVLFGYEVRLQEKDLVDFIKIEYGRIGADSHITPREVIRDFIELLDILYQYPEKTVDQVLRSGDFQFAEGGLENDEDSIPEFEL